MKCVISLLSFTAGLSLQFSATAQTNVSEAMVAIHTNTAIIPVPRVGGATNRQALKRAKDDPGDYDIEFIGDSITQFWENTGKKVWQIYGQRKVINLGVSGDHTQHVLWRFEHGQLNGIKAKVAVVMIGTNNSNKDDNTEADILAGVTAIVNQIRQRQPDTKIILLGIFPRGQTFSPQRGKILQVNEALAKLEDGKNIFFMDIGPQLIESDGSISRAIMPDASRLHPGEAGYRIWANAMEPKLKRLLHANFLVAQNALIPGKSCLASKYPQPDLIATNEADMTCAAPVIRLGYRRSLDGLRGVAILLVLLYHGQVLGNSFGFIGVNTFFVLSGFLITCLLIEEYDKSNRISLWQFYVRRGLRLLPALTVMLVAFVLFVFMVDPHKRALRELNEALFTWFYFSNWAAIYHIGRHVSLLHTWSLSVEEQFYIIWPGILLFMLGKTTRSSLACWIFLGAFLSALLRIGLFVGDTTNLSGNVLPVDPQRLLMGTDTRADSLLLGCFAGVLISSNLLPQKAWFGKLLKAAGLLSAAALLAVGTCSPNSPATVCLGWFLASLFGMILIAHLASANEGWLHWLFENRFLVFTGQISYGLYVWHFPVLEAMAQHNLHWQHMVYLIPVVPVVLLSYYLIERPCLRLKKRFSGL